MTQTSGSSCKKHKLVAFAAFTFTPNIVDDKITSEWI